MSEMMMEKHAPNQQEGRAAAKAFVKHQPARVKVFDFDFAGDLFQPRGCLFDLDALHPQFQQFLHGDGAAAIGHGDDHAMDFLLLDHVHQVSRHGFPGDRAFEFARPTGNLHANLRILAQPCTRRWARSPVPTT
jgi:hypothetical protein